MLCAFTICSTNYLAYAQVLADSLSASNPELRFTVFLADALPTPSIESTPQFTIVPVDQLRLPELYDMAARYNIMEFNTAVKPFCFEYLFARTDTEAAIYLDPDILATSHFDELFVLLNGGADIVLTPHTTQPFPSDDFTPDDTQMMRAGVFNLGFLALRRSVESERFLKWWGDHLKSECLVNTENGIFVDQKFCDLAPCYFDNVFILKHSGYNVAYWNLHERRVTCDSGTWTVNGDQPLRFFHFSGVDPLDDSKLSKHQNRHDLHALHDVSALVKSYCASLREKEKAARQPRASYFYGQLLGGAVITDQMRAVYESVQPSAPRSYAEAFSSDLALYLLAEPTLAMRGVIVTRLMFLIWSRRKDLQLVFPLASPEDAKRFGNWFAASAVREYKLPQAVVDATLLVLKSGNDAPAFKSLDYIGVRAGVSADHRFSWIASRGVAIKGPGVDYYGYFRSATGLGAAAAKLVKALELSGLPVSSHEIPGTPVHISDPVGLVFEGPRHHTALFHMNADMTTHFESCLDPRLARRPHRIGYWAWELDAVPVEWLRAYSFVDEIWTPSSFSAHAISQRTPKPVHVVSHPVAVPPEPLDVKGCRERYGISTAKLVILVAFDANSYIKRKNPLGAINAFRKAFADRKDAPQLVIKFHGKLSTTDREAVNRELAKIEDVVLITRILSDAETSDLQWACDIFLSLHRAEGFGLWIAECMARGKACVATNYSGNTDFMDESNSIPVRYSMTAVKEGQYPMGVGRSWAEPDLDHAVESLRSLAANETRRRELGLKARETIAEKLAPERIGRAAKRRIVQAYAESFVLPAVGIESYKEA